LPYFYVAYRKSQWKNRRYVCYSEYFLAYSITWCRHISWQLLAFFTSRFLSKFEVIFVVFTQWKVNYQSFLQYFMENLLKCLTIDSLSWSCVREVAVLAKQDKSVLVETNKNVDELNNFCRMLQSLAMWDSDCVGHFQHIMW